MKTDARRLTPSVVMRPHSVLELSEMAAGHPFGWELAQSPMSALARFGLRDEALATFERVAHRLRIELGVEPSNRLRHARRRVAHEIPLLVAVG